MKIKDIKKVFKLTHNRFYRFFVYFFFLVYLGCILYIIKSNSYEMLWAIILINGVAIFSFNGIGLIYDEKDFKMYKH